MTRTIVIFSGPTLPHAIAQDVLGDALFLPPARQGDIYAAWLRYKPAVIGVIDGYFENVPAPWHKEILWVMAQGVKVYGASSMGALRAAELHTFGMIGVGDIFEAYKNGEIEDDDEVAVVHGPSEVNYSAVSEAMVNIRRTLNDALAAGVIDDVCYWAAIACAKGLFYRDRTYPAILAKVKAIQGLERQTEKLESWLEKNRRNLKEEDALLMLHRIRMDASTAVEPVSYEFQDTYFWRTMKQQIEGSMT